VQYATQHTLHNQEGWRHFIQCCRPADNEAFVIDYLLLSFLYICVQSNCALIIIMFEATLQKQQEQTDTGAEHDVL